MTPTLPSPTLPLNPVPPPPPPPASAAPDAAHQAAVDAAVRDARVAVAAARQAAATPLPGPLAVAFGADDALNVAGLTLRPVVASDFAILQRLDSPMLRQAQAAAEHARQVAVGELPESAPVPGTPYEQEELAELLYQFTRPLREVRAALAQGRPAFREAAMEATFDRLPPTAIGPVMERLVENFTRCFATAVAHQAPTPSGETRVDFCRPPQPATGLGGGLATSPGSAATSAGRSTT
jgi:hypothetical protein